MGPTKAKKIELRNSAAAPASDEALVNALLEFANGAEVVIRGQPMEEHRAPPWSHWRAAPSPEERASHVELLRQIVEGGGRLRARAGPRSVAKVIKLAERYGEDFPDGPLLPHGDFPGYLANMLASVEPVMLGWHAGHAFQYSRVFWNVAAALAYATTLLMDRELPYGQSLCRCKLPTCNKFYLAEQHPEGGPPRRTYCCKTHREQYHNSAKRKASSRPRPKAKSMRRRGK